MKKYHDDARHAPPGYVSVKTVDKALSLLCASGVTQISPDHDLGNDDGIGNGCNMLF